MKRTRIDLYEIAAFPNLIDAAVKAARGKRTRADVKAFFADSDRNLGHLRNDILACRIPRRQLNKFTIFDPKKRTIHAPDFADRIAHHAVMNFVSPILDRAMVDSSFACRPCKGVHAAIRRVQRNIRRYRWYAKIDIESYFDSIDHVMLLKALQRRLKGQAAMKLIRGIIDSYHTEPGKGMPIGALPSQHFANFYLNRLDRFITETIKAEAHVRYMDDVIWWCGSRQDAKNTLSGVTSLVEDTLGLVVKRSAVQVNRSVRGVSFCGFRILPGAIRLSARKRWRYAAMRRKWEGAWQAGLIDTRTLQAGYTAVYASTAYTDSRSWRKEQLRRCPAPEC